MKVIKDIRLYKSAEKNEYGKPIATSFADKKLNAVIHRIVMKLHENGFSLGDFDHLYINFVTFDITENIYLSEEIDRYHPWYRNCFINIEKELYDSIGKLDTYDFIINAIVDVLTTYFVTEEFDSKCIKYCISHAVKQGENMLMRFKEKKSTKRKAIVFLRYLDDCVYYPLLRVYDLDNNMLFEKDLPKTLTLDCFGEIQVSTKRIKIKSRKNAFSDFKKEMIFEY